MRDIAKAVDGNTQQSDQAQSSKASNTPKKQNFASAQRREAKQNFVIPDVDYESLKAQAGDDDTLKYQMAVDLAREGASNLDDYMVDDQLMEWAIDDIYGRILGGKTSAADMRGENFFTQAVKGAKNTINDFNHDVGFIGDTAFDNTIGNLASLPVFGGEEWGNTVKNAFDADDIAMVADMAEDIGLSAIPGAGIPLAMAKNAIQQSDNFARAASGRDALTLENNVNDLQGIASGAEAGLTTLLAGLPGFGKAGNLLRVGKQAGKEAAGKAAAEAAEAAGKNADEILEAGTKAADKAKVSFPEKIAKGRQEVIDSYIDRVGQYKPGKQTIDNMKQVYNDAGGGFKGFKDVIYNLRPYGTAARMPDAVIANTNPLTSMSFQQAMKMAAKNPKKFGKIADGESITNAAKNAAMQFGGTAAVLDLAAMAETGLDPVEAAQALSDKALSDTDNPIGALGAAMMPIGIKRAGVKLPGLRGAAQRAVHSSIPYNVPRANAVARGVNNYYGADDGEYNTADELPVAIKDYFANQAKEK